MATTIINRNRENLKEMRRAYWEAVRTQHDQEQAMLIDAVEIVKGAPDGLTARQVSQFMNGAMSVQEIAQNFRYVGKRGGYATSRYEKVAEIPGTIRTRTVRTVRRFVEVDVNGKPVNDTIIERAELTTAYTYAPKRG